MTKCKVAPFKLEDGEWLETAWASPAAGPGWANSPLKVLIGGPGGWRVEYLQPDQQSRDIWMLYGISAAVNGAMLRAAALALGEQP